MTPEQFTKTRAEFIKSCGKPPLHEVLGVVYDLDSVCEGLLEENARLHDQLLSLKSIACAAFDELRSNGREPPFELYAKLEAHTRLLSESLAGEACVNLQSVINVGAQAIRKEQALKAINTRHDKEGGSRDARAQLRAIWAQGNFSTRGDCAEQERGKFKGVKGKELSLSQAIKYLRNTPDPDPWHADPKRKGRNT